jgi:hypothetical protein
MENKQDTSAASAPAASKPILAIPLVGSHFHPPAKQLLACLPAKAELRLEAEPQNPYDSEAILVFVAVGEIPDNQLENLEIALQGTGYTLEDLNDQGEFPLGHLAASGGKPSVKFSAGVGTKEVWSACGGDLGELSAVLGFLPEGQPMVVIYQKTETSENESPAE